MLWLEIPQENWEKDASRIAIDITVIVLVNFKKKNTLKKYVQKSLNKYN